MPTACGFNSPEPNPCRKRVMFRLSGSGASPAATEESVKTATPAMNNGPRPRMSPARPAATSTTPKVSA